MAFDLDKVAAEADGGEPFEFTFGGDLYQLPPRIDVRALGLLQAGRVLDALHALLGAEQTERLMAVDAVFDDRRFAALMEAYAEHQNTTVGESSASTNS